MANILTVVSDLSKLNIGQLITDFLAAKTVALKIEADLQALKTAVGNLPADPNVAAIKVQVETLVTDAATVGKAFETIVGDFGA